MTSETPQADPDSPRFTGWFRKAGPRSRWWAVVEAESWDEAWTLLDAHTEGSGDRVVLPSGRRP